MEQDTGQLPQLDQSRCRQLAPEVLQKVMTPLKVEQWQHGISCRG